MMRNLCEVLGIDFWEKMEELDIDPKVEELDNDCAAWFTGCHVMVGLGSCDL